MFNGQSCADKWLQATVDGGVPSDYDGTQTYESELSILPRRAPKPVKVGLFWGGEHQPWPKCCLFSGSKFLEVPLKMAAPKEESGKSRFDFK